jgi:Flp pilus assembly protein TadB
LVQFVIGTLVGVGLFLILADLFHVPSYRTSKAVSNLIKRQKNSLNRIDVWLNSLAVWISKKIKVNEYKRSQIATDLQTADINMSPEMHIANCIVKAFVVGIFAIPVFFIFPLLTPLIITISVVMYFKEYRSVSVKIKEKRRQVEYELPRLVDMVSKTIKHNRDVLNILENYKENAGTEIKKELSITVADMRSGNYEAALTRLEARVGSTMLSDVTRGLIGVLRGDDTDVYWTSLSLKFSDYQRQLLKLEAQRIPRKVKRLSMCLLFCFMLIYVVVIGLEIMGSIGILFK